MAGKQPWQASAASLDGLLHEQTLLRKDFEYLVWCLGHSETIWESASKFHNERSKAGYRRNAQGSPASPLLDSLPLQPLRVLQQLCGGRAEMLALRGSSRGCEACARGLFRGHEIYICGGTGATVSGLPQKTAERLQLETGEWEPLPAMPMVRRAGCTGAAFGGHMYVCGGPGDFGNTAVRFSCMHHKWERLPSMGARRNGAASTVAGGKVCVYGGQDDVAGAVLSSVEVFDPAARSSRVSCGRGAWEALPVGMTVRRRHFAAATLVGRGGEEEVFVCGGVASPTGQQWDPHPHTSAEALRWSDDGATQRSLPAMAGPRVGHVAAFLCGRVYVCGGNRGNGVGLTTVECFDPGHQGGRGAWSFAPPMLLERDGAASAVVAGRLYVLGGCRAYAPNAPAEQSVEHFDPVVGHWEAGPQLLDHRWACCAGAAWTGALASEHAPASPGGGSVGTPPLSRQLSEESVEGQALRLPAAARPAFSRQASA
mmetsp:Transcript_49533/g.152857  ORF Transcript_49533/g.152857 Transcript_49533/m.152857 type:complete len:484 (+) Transcript_49533:76-1527(+)